MAATADHASNPFPKGRNTITLRKIAGLLTAFGLTIGLIGSGVGASFLDHVTGTENISVGTFACGITSATPADAVSYGNVDAAGYAHSVTYTAPQIGSSAPGSAPFTFTVKNTGSIDQVLTVAMTAQTGNLGSHFSAIPATPSPVGLAAGASQTISTGIQWTSLVSDDLGRSGSMTWTVNCGENAPTAIFDNTPAVVPSNLPSYGVEAYYFNEWGAGVTFAGTLRNLATATVTMSSWACETGSWTDGTCVTTPGHTYAAPITFKIYAVGAGNAVGTVIATQTQTFQIPFRPSYDAINCPASAHSGNGLWWDGTSCKNGLAANVTFTFPTGTTLPNSAIFGIAYNTDTNGYSPLHGTGSPLDSLNIATYPGTGTGLVAVAPSVGSWSPDGLSVYASNNLPFSSFAGPTTSVSAQMNDFGGYMPAVQITATN